MNTEKEIEKLRRKVDAFDDRILDILVQRFSVVKEIGQIKSISTINIDHPDREKEIIERLADKLKGKLHRKDIMKILKPIFEISKKFQVEE
ncbi:MAG: chorismate mutase [Candidatus Neomarinimicrobiota bacterium]|nr:chorismate mutase [Candidatus Neomarinimicrobiota bacterium]